MSPNLTVTVPTRPPQPSSQTILIPRRAGNEVQKIFQDLPGQLSGRIADPDHLRGVFFTHFTYRLLSLFHRGFMAKSKEGGIDDLGTKWKPLADSTIKRKLAKRKKLASQIARHPSLRKMSSKDRQIQSMILARQSVPIGIDTNELEKSYRPGTAYTYTYRPPKNQVVEIERNRVRISTKVEHAAHFHRKRRIYPAVSRMKPWIVESCKYARDRLIEQIRLKLRR